MSTIYQERLKDLPTDLQFGLKPCMKKPITVLARHMTTDFRVETLEGNYKQGKAGDYLMCGIDDELYICDKDIFERSYDWL